MRRLWGGFLVRFLLRVLLPGMNRQYGYFLFRKDQKRYKERYAIGG